MYAVKIYPCYSWEDFPSHDTKNTSKSTADEFNYSSALYITIHYPKVIKIKHLDAIVNSMFSRMSLINAACVYAA